MKLVFDIGGTNFRSAILDKGVLSELEYQITPSYLNCSSDSEIKQEIVKMIYERASGFSSFDAIGVGFPGPTSLDGSVIGSSVIFNDVLGEPYLLQFLLREKLAFQDVYVTNDMVAAAWRYIPRYSSFCIVTISSGIGNKVVIDGKVQIGTMGLEGEMGHLPAFGVNEVDISCSCGYGTNHLGGIASGRGIVDVANMLKTSLFVDEYKKSSLYTVVVLDSEQLSQAASAGDVFARKLFDYCTKPLAYQLCSLAGSEYLEKIILIGGLIQHSEYYLESLIKNFVDIGIYNYSEKMLKNLLVLGDSDDFHGLLGMENFLNFKLEDS